MNDSYNMEYTAELIDENIISINDGEAIFEYLTENIHHLEIINNQIFVQFPNKFKVEDNDRVIQILDEYDYLSPHTEYIDTSDGKNILNTAITMFTPDYIDSSSGIITAKFESTNDILINEDDYHYIEINNTPLYFNEDNIYYHVNYINKWLSIDIIQYDDDNVFIYNIYENDGSRLNILDIMNDSTLNDYNKYRWLQRLFFNNRYYEGYNETTNIIKNIKGTSEGENIIRDIKNILTKYKSKIYL